MDFDLVSQNLSAARFEKVKTAAPERVSEPSGEKELKQACAGFEAIFLNTLIKSMRDSLPGNAVFKESNAGNIFQSMQDQYLSEELSRSQHSTGLKEFLYEQLKETL